MAFKLSKDQLATRSVVVADLRRKASALNVAIATFNREVEPLSRAVAEAQTDYNEVVGLARTLASQISQAAPGEIRREIGEVAEQRQWNSIRMWIEQWEMSLDDVDLDLPEPLEEIDPDGHAGGLESGSATDALSVSDGAITVGYIVERDGSHFSFDDSGTLLGEFRRSARRCARSHRRS